MDRESLFHDKRSVEQLDEDIKGARYTSAEEDEDEADSV